MIPYSAQYSQRYFDTASARVNVNRSGVLSDVNQLNAPHNINDTE